MNLNMVLFKRNKLEQTQVLRRLLVIPVSVLLTAILIWGCTESSKSMNEPGAVPTRDTVQSTSGQNTFNCKRWEQQIKPNIKHLLQTLDTVSGQEWHDCYGALSCEFVGEIQLDKQNIRYTINSGGWIITRVGEEQIFLVVRPAMEEAVYFEDTGFCDEDGNLLPERNSPAFTCIACDSIYSAFPHDSSSFDRMYSYESKTGGLRYGFEQGDIGNYFDCLHYCYDEQALVKAFLLGPKIKFEADGPSFLQHHVVNFSMQNDSLAVELYRNLSYREFTGVIRFMFEGMSKWDSFYPKLCDHLMSLDYQDDEKIGFVSNLCSSAASR